MMARAVEGSYRITREEKRPSKLQSDRLLRILRAHQVGTHEVVKSMFSDPVFLDDRECPHCATTKVAREERAAHQELLDFIFDGDWEGFQPDL